MSMQIDGSDFEVNEPTTPGEVLMGVLIFLIYFTTGTLIMSLMLDLPFLPSGIGNFFDNWNFSPKVEGNAILPIFALWEMFQKFTSRKS